MEEPVAVPTLPALPNPKIYMRLFCMDPGASTDKITGSFEVVPIVSSQIKKPDDHTPYIALSHCWGESKDSLPILVEGKLLEIRQTLHEALIHLRLADRTLKLWAVEICIDQDDLDERSKQIRRMDNIFEFADTVVAWLGPATESSDLLFRAL